MKIRFLRIGVVSSIFLALVLLGLALLYPVYKQVKTTLVEISQKYTEVLKEKTGLTIGWESMSPSVFTGVHLKGVSVYDSETDARLLHVRNINIGYSFWDLVTKNAVKSLKEVVVDGVSVEYDQGMPAWNKITGLMKKDGKKVSSVKEKQPLNLEDLELELPFRVIIKNIALHYSDEKNDFRLTVDSATFGEQNGGRGVQVKTSGQIQLQTSLLTTNGHRSLAACGFSVSGTLLNSLEGSSANIRFSPVNSADYTISRMDTLVNFSDSAFHVRSVRSILPYSVLVDFNVVSKDFNFKFDSANLDPSAFLRLKNPASLYSRLSGSTLTCNSYANKTGEAINYGIKGTLNLNKDVLGSATVFNFDFDGDKNFANLNRLTADGQALGMDLSLNYNIASRQPSGVLNLDHLVLKNGGVISTEVYVDPLNKGFMCFSPQVFFDDRSLTALQLQVIPAAGSVDFAFEVDDYSHADYDRNGHIAIEGSYIGGKQKTVQASVRISDIFADSVVNLGAFFAKGQQQAKLKNTAASFANFITTDEIYFSTDFKNYSYNAPLCVVANIKNDRQIVVFSVDGSKETVQLSRFDLLFGSNTVNAQAALDLNRGFRDFTFASDMTINSLPYRFSGNYSQKWLNVTGDYNFNSQISFDDEVLGSLSFDSLPVSLGKNIFAFSTNMNFFVNSAEGANVVIDSFAVEEAAGNISFRPKVVISGTANRYGLVFDTISYSDTSSVQQGNGSILWNQNGSIFDSIRAGINTSSPLTPENISITVDITNPNQKPFNFENLKNDFYLSAVAEINSLPLSRFSGDQNTEDVCTAQISASGTLANPFITANLQKFQMSIHGFPLEAHGSCIYDDTGLNINDFEVMYNNFGVKDLFATFNPKDFTAKADAFFTGKYMKKNIGLPLKISARGLKSDSKKKIQDLFNVLVHSDVSGELFPTSFPIDIELTKIPGQTDIKVNKGSAVVATLYDDGHIDASSGKDSVVKFNVKGSVVGRAMDVNVSGINADLAQFSKYINLVFVDFKKGILNGAARITGLTTDPEITGAITINEPHLIVPVVSDKEIFAERLMLTAGNGLISLPPTVVSCGKGLCDIEAKIQLDRMKLASVNLKAKTHDRKPIPVDMSFPMVHAKGNAGADITLDFVPGLMKVRGDVLADNATVEVIASSFQKALSDSDSTRFIPIKKNAVKLFDVDTQLTIKVGQKVQFLFNPLLRAVIAPDTSLKLTVDSVNQYLGLLGDLTLRGGEVAWLNRNFYLKEGQIKFNETKGKIDPRVTIRAETRERDENGNRITIILSAKNQAVSQFNPQISASPAKSEREIMELLGQVISADSSNATDVAMAGGDYLVQATVIRSIENTLRETLNFDIFSIRTNVLQNTVKQTMNQNASDHQITFGNFFDNSTVYIGKYFGSSMYFDTLMHWSYDEAKDKNDNGMGGIVFQPEIGFEMASPLVNIRLGVAPDLDALSKNIWNPQASVTLSWKYSF